MTNKVTQMIHDAIRRSESMVSDESKTYTYPEFVARYFPNDNKHKCVTCGHTLSGKYARCPKCVTKSWTAEQYPYDDSRTRDGFREAWAEKAAGDIHPIETLWDGIDEDE